MKIETTTVTAVSYPPGPIDFDLEPTITRTPIVIVDGVAPTPPSNEDYWLTVGLESPETEAGYLLPYAVENLQKLLGALDETTSPDVRVRWTVVQAIRAIRQATDDIERYVARNGLWLSEDEFFECEGQDMRWWHHEDFQAKADAELAAIHEKWAAAEAASQKT